MKLTIESENIATMGPFTFTLESSFPGHTIWRAYNGSLYIADSDNEIVRAIKLDKDNELEII